MYWAAEAGPRMLVPLSSILMTFVPSRSAPTPSEVVTPEIQIAPDPAETRWRDHVRTWHLDDFELRLYDIYEVDRLGKDLLAYELFDRRHDPSQIFAGEDFAVSPLDPIDSDAVAAAVLSFLSLRPGDVEPEYFDSYTPAQLEWRDCRAEDLSLWARHLQRRHQWWLLAEQGETRRAVEAVVSYGDIEDLFEVFALDVFEASVLVDSLGLDTDDPSTVEFLVDLHRRRMAELRCESDDRWL